MASSTAELILRHTIVAIEAQGEASVRVKELADEVGVAVTSLYHFYGSREGLIEAAQARRYATALRSIAAQWDAQFRSCRTQRELRALFRRQVHEFNSPDHADERRAGLNVVGSALGRPHLAEAIGEAQREFVTTVAAALTVPQHKGWVRRDLDLEAFSAWYIGQLTSRELIEMGHTGIDGGHWNRIVTDAVLAVVFGEVMALQAS
jgi:AcrR family transcriptional regulator